MSNYLRGMQKVQLAAGLVKQAEDYDFDLNPASKEALKQMGMDPVTSFMMRRFPGGENTKREFAEQGGQGMAQGMVDGAATGARRGALAGSTLLGGLLALQGYRKGFVPGSKGFMPALGGFTLGTAVGVPVGGVAGAAVGAPVGAISGLGTGAESGLVDGWSQDHPVLDRLGLNPYQRSIDRGHRIF